MENIKLKNEINVETVEIKVDFKNPQYMRAKLEDIEGTSHLIDDNVIYTEEEGNITAVSIWGQTIGMYGITGIRKIIITNNTVNVYIRDNQYKTPFGTLQEVRYILEETLGHTNASQLLDTPFYTLYIK